MRKNKSLTESEERLASIHFARCSQVKAPLYHSWKYILDTTAAVGMKNCYKAYLLLARLLSLHFSVKNDSWYSGQRALAIISPRDVKATVEEKAPTLRVSFLPRCM